MRNLKLTCLTTLVLLLPLGVGAADFDGSQKLLCAPADVAECVTGPACESVTAEDIKLPEFIAIDFTAKRISDGSYGGSKETTAIQNVRKVNGRLILQGAESGRAWSVVIHQSTGKMTAAVAAVSEEDVRVGFVLFGDCTPDP